RAGTRRAGGGGGRAHLGGRGAVPRGRALRRARGVRGLRRRARDGAGPRRWSRRARGGAALPRPREPVRGHHADRGHHRQRGRDVGGHRGHHHHLRAPGAAAREPRLGGGLLEVHPDRLGRHRPRVRRHGAGVLRVRHRGRAPGVRSALDGADGRGARAPPGRHAAVLRVHPGGLRHEGGPGSHAHLAARRPRGSPGRALRHDVGRAAGRRAVRDRAVEGGGGPGGGRAGARRPADGARRDLPRGGRAVADRAAALQAPARLLEHRAYRPHVPGPRPGPARGVRLDAAPGEPHRGQVDDVPPLRADPGTLPHRRHPGGLRAAPHHAGDRRALRGGRPRAGGAAAGRPLPLQAGAAPGRLRHRARLAHGARARAARGGVRGRGRPAQPHALRRRADRPARRGDGALGPRAPGGLRAGPAGPRPRPARPARDPPAGHRDHGGAMKDLDALARALAGRLDGGLHDVRVVRGRELHCRIEPRDARRLALVLRADHGAELRLMVGNDRRADAGRFEVYDLFAHPREHWFVHAAQWLPPEAPALTSLATFYYPASLFERELFDLFGIRASGHPDPRPLVRHAFWPEDYFPLRKDAAPRQFQDDGSPFPFTEVGGEGVYEIPVGPVHAGVIEPGHFRFSVVGETIIDMKSRLYFTHKGTEKLFEGRAPGDGVALAERVSGDTTVGHSLAYCQALESAAGTVVPERARRLRVVLLEMERLYNHVGDFGMIANDTGYAVAHSHCFRIRERVLRLNRRLTGNRLLRGGVVPGGVGHDLPPGLDLPAEVDAAVRDFDEIAALTLRNTLVMDRLEET